MKKIIIAEKPSVGREYARFLGVNGQNGGYMENDEWIVTWSVGHLVTLSYPHVYDEKYKKWNLDDLPFLPSLYRYEVIENVKKQFSVVKNLYNRTDISTIYLAGDPAREGITIQSYILDKAGYNKSANVLVVWVDSVTDSEIRKGIRNAKPLSEYQGLIDSGYERAIEDYALGINFSRALSLKFGYIGSDNKSHPVSVGRVMTTVLGMVVRRENEIKNFKETVFYKISADMGEISSEWKATEQSDYYNSELLYDNVGFLDKNNADAFIKKLSSNAKLLVNDIRVTSEKKNAPTLFNLAELQNECSRLFKISPNDTLNIAQKLYEAKLISYPRTDARVLTKAMFSEIKGVLKGLEKNPLISAYKSIVSGILESDYSYLRNSKRYVDDSKVSDHYAIIPTGLILVADLSSLESKVYVRIVKRFLSIFLPAAEYQKVAVTFKHSLSEYFFANSKKLVKRGYLALYDANEEDSKEDVNTAHNALLTLEKGNVLTATFSTKEGKTQPPKRYTSGSMILAMENAGNLIDDEELRAQIKGSGIGTSATRAGIIKKLIDIKYLNLNKKTQVLTPADDGLIVYDIVNASVPLLLEPKMTASWEKGLSQIEIGEVTKELYHQKLEDYIRKTVASIKEMEEEHRRSSNTAAGAHELVGKCPVCGRDMYSNSKGYGCSGFSEENGCKFFIPYSIAKKKLPKSALESLLKGEKTALIKGFTSKDKKKFSAMLVIKDGKICYEFEEREKPAPSSCTFECPKCGNTFTDNGYSLQCSCGVKINKTIASHKLSDNELKSLLAGRTGVIKDFKTREGKPFKTPAAIVLNEEYETKFLFE